MLRFEAAELFPRVKTNSNNSTFEISRVELFLRNKGGTNVRLRKGILVRMERRRI